MLILGYKLYFKIKFCNVIIIINIGYIRKEMEYGRYNFRVIQGYQR